MDWTPLFQTILPYLPAKYAGDIVSIITFLIAAAALALRFWKPPSNTSRLLPLFRIVSALAQAKGWNTSAYQPGAKALMVPLGSSRAEGAAKLGLDAVSTHPKAGEPPRRAE
ncbi:hypothetical protein [Gluconobacter kanchanaburiensis]|uniref:Uncharacterized protein n=1 Tax=Gluconobacter kanchanaburiensis NBRC 103587 TaxID=1307948 RepID=A0A511B903_9PROT|nr:hypothetical protein [Gluconobacter kanchanaburiensis]MBF0862606.1 hypothetical protein [Gluconobacter kanchanaburiensis]GBR71935.1 hypothetical protein AA103587_2612 [Gluconobacter kanchanaburiensis NBRC 103587]GEK96899.1 hypothetical protein GKA01_20960 [Gluconobacter kanchanaburiensis NBRC 103587]